ncbi:thiamine phosphate synthase [Brevundimonas diminuta]|uniref:thiamine phosphate synthase n=1 Tax=Brevundimonas diminuta TaxID=293 RepID=UPI001F5A1C0D|nr:thiamine phosphate synthase [Brevundimonas diminuta]
MILPAGYSDDARALWNAATALNRAAAAVSPAAAALPAMLFFTDPDRTPRPWETAARLPAGSAVVYRAFGASDAIETGHRLREATADRDVKLLVGLAPDLAEAIDADGLHLPERAADQVARIRSDRPGWILTAAWHGLSPPPKNLNALILSPVFAAGGASASKIALGVAAFEQNVKAARLPVYALGGVTPENAETLAYTGACGLAAVDAIQSAFR